jgi:phage gp36-like protein
MAYLTPLDLITRYGAEEIAQLADRGVPRRISAALMRAVAAGDDLSGWPQEDAEAASQALVIVVRAIDDGESEIDSYLSSRYAVPLKHPPGVILRFSGDIARYALYEDHAKDEVRKRYEQAIAFLRDVAAGKASIDAALEPPVSGGIVEMVTAGKVFGRGKRGL